MGSTNITIKNIKKIFQDMFQQHQEAITKKQEDMFRSHENSIIQLISGNTTLTNQRLDNLSKEIAGLKESLEFKTKLQGILKKQKHAARIIFHANRLDHSKPLSKEMKALNFYQINLIQTLKFMHKTKYRKNPRVFLAKFREVDHQYPTRFSKNSFCYKRSACKSTSFAITIRGPTIWNSFLSSHEKSIPNLSSFLKQTEFKLLNSNNETGSSTNRS